MAPHSDSYGFVKTLLGDATTTFSTYSHIALLFFLAGVTHAAVLINNKAPLIVVVAQVTVVTSKISGFEAEANAASAPPLGKHSQVFATDASFLLT